MIDPANITNYYLTPLELEEHILFWVCAAGKNGTVTARLLNKLLLELDAYNIGSFNAIKQLGLWELSKTLKRNGIGCYNQKARTILELANSGLDLRTCTAEDLETIYGIGMKTSRCFIIHSRKNSNYAGLDTHMLKNLRMHNIQGVPFSTPTNKKLYKRLELEVLRLANESDMSPANYDLMIWNKYSIKGKEN